ncbi:MAG: hypothetical protein PHC68_00620 [Syntrophorhabdaceae bacterium]|nr:hypothetical protein [Syntrophorhabdaceae bacterium]
MIRRNKPKPVIFKRGKGLIEIPSDKLPDIYTQSCCLCMYGRDPLTERCAKCITGGGKKFSPSKRLVARYEHRLNRKKKMERKKA